MSAFTDPSRPLPAELKTAEFALRPITVADTERDYAAVIASREHLRLWQQSTWPEDDFTVDDNRVDVVDMQTRHDARRAFTYTVLDPTGVECLGCVYIFPTSATFLTKATVTAVGGLAWDDVDAVVYFWVRPSHMSSGADARLLAALRTWFDEEWGFDHTVYATSAAFAQQVELIERTGMTLQFEVREPHKPGPGFVFGGSSHTSRWTDYYKGVTGRSPRPEFLDALGQVPAALPRTAIDLGAGDGAETRHLLEQGWSVHAIDLTPGLRDRVVASLAADPGSALTTLDSAFADVAWLPPASFVYAGLSLPFARPDEIEHLMALIASSLQEGGVFAGHFFGERDSWSAREDVTVHTRDELVSLLGGFGDVAIHEREYDGPSGAGPKHWHIRFVIARVVPAEHPTR